MEREAQEDMSNYTVMQIGGEYFLVNHLSKECCLSFWFIPFKMCMEE